MTPAVIQRSDVELAPIIEKAFIPQIKQGSMVVVVGALNST